MNISVVVIAHNEEVWLGECLDSLMKQSVNPSEIVVVLHNCTDKSKKVADDFPVKIVECHEDGGPIIARARGVEASSGEIICCTDGDCRVDRRWVENISKHLMNNGNVSIVGGYTKIENNLFWRFSCWWQFVINRKILNKKHHRFIWGSNFAFRKNDYEKTGGLIPFLKIHSDLKINYWAEDLYLSLALQKIGKIYFSLNALVYTFMPPEKASPKSQVEIVKKQLEDNEKLFSFFKI